MWIQCVSGLVLLEMDSVCVRFSFNLTLSLDLHSTLLTERW